MEWQLVAADLLSNGLSLQPSTDERFQAPIDLKAHFGTPKLVDLREDVKAPSRADAFTELSKDAAKSRFPPLISLIDMTALPGSPEETRAANLWRM